MKKKILALILASAMTIGASMTAFAANDTTLNDTTGLATGAEVVGTADVNVPTIEVVVPTTSAIVINPFSIAYESQDKSVKGSSQIVSAEQTITNNSDVAIAVNVAALSAAPKTAGDTAPKIVTSAPGTKSTEKEIFLYLEVQAPGTDGTYTFEEGYNSKSTQQLVATNPAADEKSKTVPASKESIVTLSAKPDEGDAKPAKFKFGGAVVTNPVITNADKTTTQNPWTEDDVVTVALKFTFTPQANTVSGD